MSRFYNPLVPRNQRLSAQQRPISACQRQQLSPESSDWPTIALIPKKETQAWDFVQQNPTADGTGVVLAIMDSGVDPGAPGLMQTSGGQVKVIERYDCSGAGDVDMSTIVSPTVARDGKLTIEGRTGRTLEVPACWVNPCGTYRVGFKPLFELYPEEVIDRIKKERRDTVWTPGQYSALCQAEQRLVEFKRAKSQFGLSPRLHALERQNQEAQVFMLQVLESKHEDSGPMIECVLFKDGEGTWNACLAIQSDLSQAPVLREYTKFHEYCCLLPSDRFNLSINVWDDGDLLEIVGCSDSHGTHVAAISAACHPCNPKMNGVAPGAQIVSLTIGDNRLGCQESGTALVRAMARVLQCPTIDVINMSYGELTHWAPDGKIADMMKEVVDRKGAVWVVAAGNEGPALSTLHSPCWLSEDILIGVGAYLSPEMMRAQYSYRQTAPGQPYTFTSRGPAFDGGMCVHVCAPGGAVSSLPNYTLQGAQQFNGTSMAAPHCAGCVCLMLSLARQRGVSWTPYSVKSSLVSTALDFPFPDPFAKGYGLVQVPAAYEMLAHLSLSVDMMVRYNVRVRGGGCPGHPMTGIYIRDPVVKSAKQYKITISPKFFQTREIDTSIKISFQKKLSLNCSAYWLSVPAVLEVNNACKDFVVRVDPERLKPGLYFTRIEAKDYDEGDGRLFSVFATVIVPIQIDLATQGGLVGGRPGVNFGSSLFPTGCIRRYFVSTPIGSSWGVLNIRNNPRGGRNDFFRVAKAAIFVHILTIRPGDFDQPEVQDEFWLDANEDRDIEFPAIGEKVVEIVICRNFHDVVDSVQLTASVRFHGLRLNDTEICTSTANFYRRIDISSPLGPEDVEPCPLLTHQVQLLRPTNMRLQMKGGPRELLADGKFHHELEVTYEFTISEPTEIMLDCPVLSRLLYEADYPAQLWMLFDHNKQYLTSGDSVAERWAYDITRAGDYTVRLQVRHEDPAALLRFMTPGGEKGLEQIPKWTGSEAVPLLPMLLKMRLTSDIQLGTFFTVRAACGTGEEPDWPLTLLKDNFMVGYIRTVIEEDSVKDLPGDSTLYFEGRFSYSRDPFGAQFCRTVLKVTVPGESRSRGDDERSKFEPVRTLPLDQSLELYRLFKGKDDRSLDLHLARLDCLRAEFCEGSADPKTLQEIVTLSDLILSRVEPARVLTYFGSKNHCAPEPEAEEGAEDWPKQRAAIVRALSAKGHALLEAGQEDDDDEEPFPETEGRDLGSLDQIYEELLLHADPKDPEVVDFTIEYLIFRKFHALAIQYLIEKRDTCFKKWSKKWDLKLRACYGALNWHHCLFFLDDNIFTQNPPEFRLF